jgi:predicted DNA-binding ribbon-helix-helix protein
MHRTQISLEEWQYESLRAQAEREGRSLAALIREILTKHLKPSARSRLREIEGVAEGPPDLGRHHDRYLYGD